LDKKLTSLIKTACRFAFIFVLSTACLGMAVGQSRQKNAPASANSKLPSADAIAEAGVFEGQLYSNKLLGFSMLMPGGWNIFSKDQNKAALDAGRNSSRAANAGLSQAERDKLESSIENTQILFQAASRPEAEGKSTAFLSCGAERLASATTKEQYSERNKKLVLMISGSHLTRDMYDFTIGGISFSGFDIDGTADGRPYAQSYLVTVRKGTALFVVTTSMDGKNQFALDAAFKTVKFAK